MAILAVAFVVLAAVPAALTDSDAADSNKLYSDDGTTEVGTTAAVTLTQDTTYYVSGSITWTPSSISLTDCTLTIKKCTGADAATVTMGAPKTISGTGALAIDSAVTFNTGAYVLTIGTGSALDGRIVLSASGGGITLTADGDAPAEMEGTIGNGTNTIILNKVTAGASTTDDDLKITQTSGNGTGIAGCAAGASGASMQISEGTVKVAGGLTLNVNMTIRSGATCDTNGQELTISADKTLTNGGTLDVKGTTALNGSLASNGTMKLSASASALTVGADGKITNGTIAIGHADAKIVLTAGADAAQLVNVTVTDGSDDEVVFKNIRAGESAALNIIGQITVSGTADGDSGSSIKVAEGTLSLAAATTLDVNTEVAADGTLAASSFVLTNNATLTVYGSLTSTGGIKNYGKIIAANGGDISGATINQTESTGTVTITTDESDMNEVEIKGTIDTNTYGTKQIVTIGADSTLVADATLKVSGKLIIPEGVTLTVEADATLELDDGAIFVVEGTLIIEEDDDDSTTGGELSVIRGYVQVYGSIVNGGIISTTAGTFDIEADGIVTVTEDEGSIFDINGGTVTVNDSGALIINGALEGIVYNEGTITFDSDVEGKSAAINMMEAGAVVDVVQYAVVGNASGVSSMSNLTITDKYLIESTYTDQTSRQSVNVVDTGEENKIVIAPQNKSATYTAAADYLYSASGIKMVSKTTTDDPSSSDSKTKTTGYNSVTEKQYYKNIDISGTVGVSIDFIAEEGSADTTTYVAAAGITLSKESSAKHTGFKVTGDLTLGDNVTLTIGAAMTVTGSVSTGSADATIAEITGSVTVSSEGEISVIGATLTSDKVTATHYKTVAKDSAGKSVTTNHYVDINKALKVVSAEGSEVTELTLVGAQTIKATAELPAGVTLNVAKALTIKNTKEEITFTVADGAVFKASANVDVQNTLFAENKSDIKTPTNVESAVKTEQLDADGKAVKNGWAKWTNLSVALSEAQSGDVITVTAKVTVKSNMTIPEGVTVDLDTYDLVINDGITLTVDGILKNGVVKAQSAFTLTAQKVTTGTTAYSSAIVVSGKLMIDGTALYKENSAASESGSGVALTAGAPIAGLYYTEGEYSVIAGIDTALEDVSEIVGDITVNGKVTGGDYSVKATSGFYEIVVGTSTTNIETILSVKSLTLDGVTLDVDGYFTGAVAMGDDSITATHAAGFEMYTSSSKTYVSGAIDIKDLGDSFSVATGKVYTGDISGVTVNTTSYKETALTVASGAELIVDKTVISVGRMVVDGTLTVPSTKTITVTYLQVNGTVSVDAATATASKGILNIADDGTLKVGTSSSSTGAGAVFNGPVTLVDSAVAFVYTGATVDSAFLASVEDCHTTAFYVDGSVWMTAYSSEKTGIGMQYPPKANVTAKGWASYEGGSDTKDSTTSKYIIGAYPSLYYLYDTVIYDIMILADEGVDNVYLNGQAMAYGMFGNADDGYTYGYYLKVAAGTYKVTYTLKNGYSGTATLALNGTEYSTATVSGASFTVSGDAGDVNLQLTGIEKSGYVDPVEPEKKDDGLTVTDYLLIVLVILVVVLAVIVALRLMRS